MIYSVEKNKWKKKKKINGSNLLSTITFKQKEWSNLEIIFILKNGNRLFLFIIFFCW